MYWDAAQPGAQQASVRPPPLVAADLIEQGQAIAAAPVPTHRGTLPRLLDRTLPVQFRGALDHRRQRPPGAGQRQGARRHFAATRAARSRYRNRKSADRQASNPILIPMTKRIRGRNKTLPTSIIACSPCFRGENRGTVRLNQSLFVFSMAAPDCHAPRRVLGTHFCPLVQKQRRRVCLGFRSGSKPVPGLVRARVLFAGFKKTWMAGTAWPGVYRRPTRGSARDWS